MKFSYIDEGKGETLVFIHSYLWDKEMWRPQIEELKKDFRCIAIDLPIMESLKMSLEAFHWINRKGYFRFIKGTKNWKIFICRTFSRRNVSTLYL